MHAEYRKLFLRVKSAPVRGIVPEYDEDDLIVAIRPWMRTLCGLMLVAPWSVPPARAADTPQPAAPKMTMAPGCKFSTNSAGRIRVGDNIPVSVS